MTDYTIIRKTLNRYAPSYRWTLRYVHDYNWPWPQEGHTSIRYRGTFKTLKEAKQYLMVLTLTDGDMYSTDIIHMKLKDRHIPESYCLVLKAGNNLIVDIISWHPSYESARLGAIAYELTGAKHEDLR